jgi:ParB-like chromosome segregation protein Spo0J
VTLDPHPYALMLPGLTDEEYAALKDDIAAHGILVPVIVDADGLVLDGVHRVRIAAELGIEPPLSQMGHMDDERKMHLAVGLNMRRRQLDAARRRELVRALATEQALSVRKIASITGWSKSTVARDLTDPSDHLALAAHYLALAEAGMIKDGTASGVTEEVRAAQQADPTLTKEEMYAFFADPWESLIVSESLRLMGHEWAD